MSYDFPISNLLFNQYIYWTFRLFDESLNCWNHQLLLNVSEKNQLEHTGSSPGLWGTPCTGVLCNFPYPISQTHPLSQSQSQSLDNKHQFLSFKIIPLIPSQCHQQCPPWCCQSCPHNPEIQKKSFDEDEDENPSDQPWHQPACWPRTWRRAPAQSRPDPSSAWGPSCDARRRPSFCLN